VTEISLVRGSVLDLDVDAVLNAANIGMRGGGGLDGAVHHAAGPGLLTELREKVPTGAPTGSVVVTGGHASGFKALLHTPGPVWKGGSKGEPDALAACYRNALQAAHDLGLSSLGLPSISTGIYGYPIERAAPVAVRTVREWVAANEGCSLGRIVFAMFGENEYRIFQKELGLRG
jgi:O-acetyl-ADP-ribose deacetylase (regulator of RNase III)